MCWNQLKSLSGIETSNIPSWSLAAVGRRWNQLKSLSGIETFNLYWVNHIIASWNQLKSLSGIETSKLEDLVLPRFCWNQLKSLSGIETTIARNTAPQTRLKSTKIPIRDWNWLMAPCQDGTEPLKSTKIPIRDWNDIGTDYPIYLLGWNQLKSLSGIETEVCNCSDIRPALKSTKIPIRDWNYIAWWRSHSSLVEIN